MAIDSDGIVRSRWLVSLIVLVPVAGGAVAVLVLEPGRLQRLVLFFVAAVLLLGGTFLLVRAPRERI